MARVSSFRNGFVPVAPGFEICEIVKNKDVSVAHIKMNKKEVPRYPVEPDKYTVLTTDMYVTVLQGIVQFEEKDKERRMCYQGDKIVIERGTRYAWILESSEVILHVTNNPPFTDEDRKI